MSYKVKLIKSEEITDATWSFSVTKPAGFEFRPGQYCDLKLLQPEQTDQEGDTRTLSIAAAPYEADLLFATRMRDTAYKRVIKDLPAAAELELDGPYGDFTLHKTETVPAVFIIGGIGVTPVRSIVAQASRDKLSQRIILIHSCRSSSDFPFKADFEAYSKLNPNFSYIPVLSDVEPGASNGWSGEVGRVDEPMIKRIAADLNSPIYYLSGPEGMVRAMRQLLVSLPVNEDNIKTEEFSGY